MRFVFMHFLLWITPELLEKKPPTESPRTQTHRHTNTHQIGAFVVIFFFRPLVLLLGDSQSGCGSWQNGLWSSHTNVFRICCHSFFIFNRRGGVDSFLLLTFLKTNSKGGNFNSNHVLGQLLICRICSSPLQQRARTLIWNCVRAHFISIYFSVF